MKKNIPLLKKLRTRFLRMRHPEHFNMVAVTTKTDCGTAMCIAGHALDLAGYKRRYVGSPWASVDGMGDHDWYTPSGCKVQNSMSAARRLLGLTKKEAQDERNYNEDNGLFLRFDLETPKQAAAEIQRLIEGK